MVLNVYENMVGLNLDVDVLTQKEKIKKTRLVSSPDMHHLIRIDDEPDAVKKLSIDEIESIDISEYDACVISDYDKGFIDGYEISTLCNRFFLLAKPVFVDSKKTDLSCFDNCIIKINRYEYERITSYPDTYDLIITMGSDGTKYQESIFPPFEVDIDGKSGHRDVCGAGDTFLAGLVKMYLEKKNIREAIPFANCCAAIVVNKFGVAVINEEEVRGSYE
jgi:bifunctional ADP-heptose synthase (sugar kinase/adenylyltransferase)